MAGLLFSPETLANRGDVIFNKDIAWARDHVRVKLTLDGRSRPYRGRAPGLVHPRPNARL